MFNPSRDLRVHLQCELLGAGQSASRVKVGGGDSDALCRCVYRRKHPRRLIRAQRLGQGATQSTLFSLLLSLLHPRGD